MRILLALFAALPAHAATLRETVFLDHAAVRVSDLWDGVAPADDRALGPAPSPGQRIVVEAPQLAAIARQFGVDWRPSAGTERSIVERPGAFLPQDAVLDAAREALHAAGVAADAEVELPGFAPPMIPAGVNARPVVSQLAYDPPSGNFSATLSVAAPGMDPLTLRIAGHVTEMTDVIVAAHRLLPGDAIGPADLRRGRVKVSAVATEPVRLAGQAIGMTVRRSAVAGAPILVSDLARPVAIHRDEIVTITLDAGGIALSGQARALEPASLGERVRVMNTTSRAILEAEATAPGRVRVNAGTAPIASVNGALPQVALR